jgi:hypothetical protein
MKAVGLRVMIVVAFVGCSPGGAIAGALRALDASDVVGKASGVGSRPAVILRDGTVCAIEPIDPLECNPLVTIPAVAAKSIVAYGGGKFAGVFDLLGDGTPQVFVNYWPISNDPNCLPPNYDAHSSPNDACDAMALLVYRSSKDGYQLYLTLNAPTAGYGSGDAWFLGEFPRKAIFETRCGGSSGECLFYLDLHKRSLEPISDDYFLEGIPTFEDIDHNGNAEIFVPARGRDRTATQGAAVLRWTGDTYRVWWPHWKGPPYVIHAQLAYTGGDRFKEIVAVLDPAADVENGSPARELAVWKLIAGRWHLAAKTALAPSDGIASPVIEDVIPESRGARILLSNGDARSIFTCRYTDRKINCPLSKGES